MKEVLLPVLAERLREKHVEMRADQEALSLMPGAVPADEEDWGTEYLDYILSIKIVYSVEEAIAHINRYNTGPVSYTHLFCSPRSFREQNQSFPLP